MWMYLNCTTGAIRRSTPRSVRRYAYAPFIPYWGSWAAQLRIAVASIDGVALNASSYIQWSAYANMVSRKSERMETTSTKRRIVFTTVGSLGDLHPYLAIASEMQKRGFEPVLATLEIYRKKVEASGFAFRLLRAILVERLDRELMQQVLDLRNGSEYIIRNLLMPALRVAYEDTLKAAEGAALLVSHPFTFATRLVAEVRGVPWASSQLAPMGFFSPYDPPVLPNAPFLAKLRPLGPIVFRPLLALAKRFVDSWTEPYRQLRSELGLPSIGHPLFEGSYSPALVLALFSELLGTKQPDWPGQAVITGFAFYDRDGQQGLPPELARFLDSGEPPIVFTLGTSAVMDAGMFYQNSAEAARLLGRRAVLLVGSDAANRPDSLHQSVAAFDYAPFSELFPRAAAIVHSGGVGTTGQAMRSGHPMLVLPFANDQPDNADRVRRLGIARVVSRTEYTVERATQELDSLLTARGYQLRAREVGERVSMQDGTRDACSRLEALLW